MKTVLQLITSLTNEFYHWEREELTHEQINARVIAWHKSNILDNVTKGGNDRLTGADKRVLSSVIYALRESMHNRMIFGYVKDGELFTTYTDTNFKTTEDLRNTEGYEYRVWEELDRGSFYRSGKPFYITKGKQNVND